VNLWWFFSPDRHMLLLDNFARPWIGKPKDHWTVMFGRQ